jgi:hypothetical protein
MHREPTGEWTIWPWFMFRGAGFSASLLAELATPSLIEAIDRLLEAEETEAAERRAAIAALEPMLEIEHEQRRTVVGVLRKLRGGKPLETTGLSPEVVAMLARVQDAIAAHAARLQELDRLAVAERRRVSAALRDVARDSRFHEAIIWQNRSVYESGIAWLLRQPPDASNKQVRKIEHTIASYLQRYCAKNDCIGFFGPVGWGRFVTSTGDAIARPGASLLSRRTVYFEHWGIDELAHHASQDTELLPELFPRRMPTTRLEGRTLHHPTGSVELPAEIAAALAMCDGQRRAREIADLLISTSAFEDPEEVFDILLQLRERKLICWAVEIVTSTAHPEIMLRTILEAASPAVRERQLPRLESLETARNKVAAAAGDPTALARALAELDDTFTQLTGASAARRAGQMYAGRTLVYEDCVRDFEFRIGPAFIRRSEAALALVLTSARWFTYTVATRTEAALIEIHEELARETPGDRVSYIRFCERAASVLSGSSGLVDEVVVELQQRWSKILGLPRDGGAMQVSSAQLSSLVHDAFAAPHPGWPLARLQSPDVLISGRSADEVARGEGTIILGELHVGVSMLAIPISLKESPYSQEIRDAALRDVATCRVEPVSPKATSSRSEYGPVLPANFWIEFGSNRQDIPREQALAAAELVVLRTPTGLAVENRDGSLRFDAITCFERHLVNSTLARFSPIPSLTHVPRIQIDELVISRERWKFAPQDLAFAFATTPNEQLVEARRWARSHGIPRHLFVRVPEERKPVYVDLASPVFIEMFAKLIRGASQVSVSEMLPAPDELWLCDASGDRYTCELRITAVDPIAWTSSTDR